MSGYDADAIVVGGGLAGVAAAIAVSRAGLNTIHLAPSGPPDRRTSALMMPSVDFLRSAGLIDEPAALGHALTQIRIIDATGRLIRAPETLFDAAEAGMDAFGWNFANMRLLERFHAVAATLPNLETRNVGATDLSGIGIALADGSRLSAPLIVGADGKKSLVRAASGIQARETAFTQAALVCDLDLGRPIGGAVLFGIGWGMAGICPGPAISLIGFLPDNLWIFLVAMFAGSLAGSFIVPSGHARRLADAK
jgi:2-octaprenyl-6-methoxyphenol hydroxylase